MTAFKASSNEMIFGFMTFADAFDNLTLNYNGCSHCVKEVVEFLIHSYSKNMELFKIHTDRIRGYLWPIVETALITEGMGVVLGQHKLTSLTDMVVDYTIAKTTAFIEIQK